MKRTPISLRIKEGLQFRNMKQIDLSKTTGISRSMITEYLKGKYEPRQDNIYLIAKALDVNEAWLMGFDVKKERDDTSSVKDIFVSNLNMMMIIELRASGDYLYDGLHISKDRMDELLRGISKPTSKEVEILSNRLNIPQDALLSTDLTSENGKYYLNEWAKDKKDTVLIENEIVMESSGMKEARKNIVYEMFYNLDNLNLNALIKLYDYSSKLVTDINNLDKEKLNFQYILYEDDNFMPVDKNAFEKLKKDANEIKESNDKIMSHLKTLIEYNALKNKKKEG